MVCLCRHLDGLAPVDNRTAVVILQHRRERRHPIGTVRLATLGLAAVRLEVVGGGTSLSRRIELPPRTGLLYPSADARPLEAVPADERPRALLLLDGTWPHARKLYRANPWLSALPHYRLTPATPGRYRIRAEPDAQSVSTIEAIVGALQILEPETPGLERLLGAFEAMIDDQLAMIEQHARGARQRARARQRRPVAGALVERYEDLVVVCVESARDAGRARRIVRWSAVRPAGGARLDRLVSWPVGERPDPLHLAHMGLSPSDLACAVEPQLLAREWRAFVGPRPLTVAWSRSPLDLLGSPAEGDCLQLKAAYCNQRGGRCGSLEDVVAREGLGPVERPFAGRAGERVGSCVAVVELLRRELAAARGRG